MSVVAGSAAQWVAGWLGGWVGMWVARWLGGWILGPTEQSCLGQDTKIVISHIADDFRQAFAHVCMYTATVTLIQIRIQIQI